MRDFIKSTLIEVREKDMKTFDTQYKRDNGDFISIKGSVNDGNADFVIARKQENGHTCSSVPVYGMPLTDKCIVEIAEIAVEAL